MRHITLFLTIFLVTSCGSSAQYNQTRQAGNTSETTERNQKEMKTFDIEKFNENQKDGDYIFTLEDGTIVRQWGFAGDDIFKEERRKEYYPYNEFWVFFRSGKLKTYGKNFNDTSIGIQNVYNENGKLIERMDWDKPYKLTFEQIREIVLKTKGVDIYDTRQAMTFRHEGHGGFPNYYQIHVLRTAANGRQYPDYSFLLNAETGKECTPTQPEEESKKPYKTHKGKTYTKEEWEAFEKQEYEEHNKKKK